MKPPKSSSAIGVDHTCAQLRRRCLIYGIRCDLHLASRLPANDRLYYPQPSSGRTTRYPTIEKKDFFAGKVDLTQFPSLQK